MTASNQTLAREQARGRDRRRRYEVRTAWAPATAMARPRSHQFRADAATARIRSKTMTWPYWPLKMRTSSSHEGCDRDWSVTTKLLKGQQRQGPKSWSARASVVQKDDATGQMKIREVEGSGSKSRLTWCCWPWALCRRCRPCWNPSAWIATRRGNVHAPTPTTTAPTWKKSSRGGRHALRGQSLSGLGHHEREAQYLPCPLGG